MRVLRAREQGWAAAIIPVRAGWRVAYFTHAHFEEKPGTDFATLDEALGAVADLLPRANSKEQREKERDLEEILWLMLRREIDERGP